MARIPINYSCQHISFCCKWEKNPQTNKNTNPQPKTKKHKRTSPPKKTHNKTTNKTKKNPNQTLGRVAVASSLRHIVEILICLHLDQKEIVWEKTALCLLFWNRFSWISYEAAGCQESSCCELQGSKILQYFIQINDGHCCRQTYFKLPPFLVLETTVFSLCSLAVHLQWFCTKNIIYLHGHQGPSSADQSSRGAILKLNKQ